MVTRVDAHDDIRDKEDSEFEAEESNDIAC